MRVTKAIIARAKRVEELQSSAYRTGDTDIVSVFDGSLVGRYTQLADFAYNAAGQTPRQVASFTASLAHLISVDPSFITGLSEEGAWYIDEHAAAGYETLLREAATFNNLQFPNLEEDAA